MKLLVTGFAPFGGDSVNPSWEAVRLLPDAILGADLCKAELPVVFGAAGTLVTQLVRRERPDLVVLVGQAGGRTAISVERLAVNWRECPPERPDSAGNAPAGEPVIPGGPDGCFSTLPIRAMVERMRENHIPAQVSNTAGTYVCNDVFYTLMHLLRTELPNTRGGFIHVPYATLQGKPAQPSMPLSEIARGLRCGLEAAISCQTPI